MSTVACPICSKSVPAFYINSHLDSSCASATPDKPERAPSAPSSSQLLDTSSKRKALGSASASTSSPSTQPNAKRFKSTASVLEAQPLAERMRPRQLDDFVGQEQLVGRGSLLRNLIEQDRLGSMILWGPPGTGKTTLARVIASTTKHVFKELSATNCSTADLRQVFEEATNLLKLTGRKTILFIDEIQRFSKSQQDNFLPVIEAGSISLLASTTENPSFRLNNALLSRCRVFILTKLSSDDILKVLKRAVLEMQPDVANTTASPDTSSSPELVPTITDGLLEFLSDMADGDARVALGALELALAASSSDGAPLDEKALREQLRKAHLQYDRTGDAHYDTISALHKSVRGGDANAALYWLARMLQGGDDPLYVARRLIRMASEDIGMANPPALQMAVSAYQATQLIGMPECDCILAQVVVMLAESPKSVRTYKAYNAAKALVNNAPNHPVPIHLRNAPTKLMKSLGYGRDYLYNPAYAHPVTQPYLPPEIGQKRFLQDEGSLAGKKYDEEALGDWEAKELGAGEKWEGRGFLEARLHELMSAKEE